MVQVLDDVVDLNAINYDNRKLFGEELSSLGELANSKINFSPNFLITPTAFANFTKENNLEIKIKHLLGTLNEENHNSAIQVSSLIRDIIRKSAFPNDFVSKVFKKLEFIEKKEKKLQLTLTAIYTHKGIIQKSFKIENVTGESEVLTHIRDIWAYIFEHKLISQQDLLKADLEEYPVVVHIEQKVTPKITGYIRTIGDRNEKDLYIIEALDQVKISYDKRKNKIETGHSISLEWENVIRPYDLKKLIDIAHVAEKKLYYPHIIYWGKDSDIFVTGVKPVTQKIDYFSKLESIKGVPLHPGVRIGRARLIDKNSEMIMSNEEIVIVKTLTKSILNSIGRASAIISEDSLDREIMHYLKERGVPTVELAHDAFKSFRNGEILTVDATTGEITHGSITVSKN